MKAADFGRKHLFERLGIKDVYWGDEGGQSRGAYGLYLTSREMAKIGYVYLNEEYGTDIVLSQSNGYVSQLTDRS